MEFKRSIEGTIERLACHFPVVLVTGPRQVGKTTTLMGIAKKNGYGYVTLDYPALRGMAREDPMLFLQQHKPPVVIDEIQYAPELFTYIKIKVDESRIDGQYFLTGSQSFKAMRGVQESLAGRVAVVRMLSLSRAELARIEGKPFLIDDILDAGARAVEPENDVFEEIFRGGMPKLARDADLTMEEYFSSYAQTYLERDIRDLINIKNDVNFVKFLSCIALRSGRELNCADIANDLSLSPKTVAKWVELLEASGIVFLLKPFFVNTTKRIVKRPKIYFLDTGLASYLSFAANPRSLEFSQQAGSMFETYVVSEIIKSYECEGMDSARMLSYYRDSNKNEIDLIINRGNRFYPVEIKMSAEPKKDSARHFSLLEEMGLDRGDGAVICRSGMLYPLDGRNWVVPYSCI